MNQIKIISIGPGHPDYVTKAAVNALTEIDIAIGAERLKHFVTPSIPYIVPAPLVSGTLQTIEKHRDKTIGILVSGDAGFFSLAKSIAKKFGQQSVQVIPGISVVQLAFSKIAESWQDAVFVSVHGRTMENLDYVFTKKRFLLLCDSENSPRKVFENYPKKLGNYQVWVMKNLSLDDETVMAIENEDEIPDFKNKDLICMIGIIKENLE